VDYSISRIGALLDMQIAGANTAQSHPHNGIPGIENDRLGLVYQGKFSVFDVS
jgi:hypothetical protein